MPGNENDLGGRVSLDVTNFKAGIATLNQQIRVIDSGFKAAAAGMGDWGKSAEGLQSRIDALNKITDIQRQKIAGLKNVYQEIVATKGEDSKAAQDLLIRINRETEALNKNQNELRNVTGALNNFGKETDQARQKAEQLKSQLSSIAGGVAKAAAAGIVAIGAAATAAVVGMFKLADKASELSESQNVVQQTFKDSSDSVIAWTKTVQKSAGISQTNATKFVGSMGAMLKSSGLSEKAAGDMAQSLVQLTGDMSSFYNLDHDQMWEKIRSGISGETEPLKQLGINMSVANMEAFALSKGIKKSWNEMSQAEQTTLRYQYLMKATADAQGDFGRTLGTSFPNQLRVAQMQMESMTTSVGQKFLPAFFGIAKTINETFQNPAVLSSIDSISNSLAGAAQNAVNFIPALISGLQWIVNNANNIAAGAVAIGVAMATWNVVSIIQGVVGAIQAFKLANEGATVAQWALNVAMAANPIGIIITVIAALVAAIIYLWNTNEGFRKAIIGTWQAVKNAVVETVTWIINVFKQLPGQMVELGKNIIDGVVEGIKNAAGNLANSVVNAAKGALKAAKDFLGIHSPSAVMRDQVGKMIGAGMAKGITDSCPMVGRAMDNLNRGLVPGGVSGVSGATGTGGTTVGTGAMKGGNTYIIQAPNTPAVLDEKHAMRLWRRAEVLAGV